MKRSSLLAVFGVASTVAITATWLFDSASIESMASTIQVNKSVAGFNVSIQENIPFKSSNETQTSLEDHLAVTSLKDTSPPNQFDIQNGQVIENESLLAIFEYFLSLDGELTIQEITNLLSLYAGSQLDPQQVAQVLAAFNQYYDFLQHMSVSQPLLDDQADLASKLNWIKQERRAFFGEDKAQQYFGYEESYDDYQLARLDIINDQQLSTLEKEAALVELSDTLTNDLRERTMARQQTKRLLKTARSISKKLTGIDKYNARLEAFGVEATQRLTALDQEREQWNNRLETYRAVADSIYQSGLSRQDQEAAISELRQRHFSGSEINRVATLDQF